MIPRAKILVKQLRILLSWIKIPTKMNSPLINFNVR